MAILLHQTPKEGYKYIVQSELDEKEPFTVYLRPLGTRMLLDFEDRMVERDDDNKIVIAQGVFAFRLVQHGLLNWDNMLDQEGKELKFDIGHKGAADADMIANIPLDMLTEIAGVVNTISRDPAMIPVLFPED